MSWEGDLGGVSPLGDTCGDAASSSSSLSDCKVDGLLGFRAIRLIFIGLEELSVSDFRFLLLEGIEGLCSVVSFLVVTRLPRLLGLSRASKAACCSVVRTPDFVG